MKEHSGIEIGFVVLYVFFYVHVLPGSKSSLLKHANEIEYTLT